MRARRIFHAVDSHTEGMPTRVIVGGVGAIPGLTMLERRQYFVDNMDAVRTLLMFEPRGHSAMSGAILQPSTRADADWGVLFIEVSGCLPMCGHGTIGVATVLVETGMVPVAEPLTTIRLDTPAGLVVADVEVRDGRALAVTLTNVPSFSVGSGLVADVDGVGSVEFDLAFGGNFFAILCSDALGVEFDRANKGEILQRALALTEAINDQMEPVHPVERALRGCHHVYVAAPGSDARKSRHAMAISPGWYDRSPCGTGTSARMAQLYFKGELPLRTLFENESFIGTRFTGSLIDETTVGDVPAVIPTFTGRAWLTGTAQYFLADDDPFPAGFLL